MNTAVYNAEKAESDLISDPTCQRVPHTFPKPAKAIQVETRTEQVNKNIKCIGAI